MFLRSTGAASAPILFLIASVVAGCGSDGSTESTEVVTDDATCDARASEYECLEVTTSVDDLAKEQTHCSGTWTPGALECPTDPDLIGCCAFHASGGQFRQCFYSGHADNPKMVCENEIHGYWQPNL